MVESRQLTTFATLETNRKWFKRPEDNVSVVVDETDWGYMIGEIEVRVYMLSLNLLTEVVRNFEGEF